MGGCLNKRHLRYPRDADGTVPREKPTSSKSRNSDNMKSRISFPDLSETRRCRVTPQRKLANLRTSSSVASSRSEIHRATEVAN